MERNTERTAMHYTTIDSQWNGQSHCAHLWTVVFATDGELIINLNEMQKTPGLYQSKESTVIPRNSAPRFNATLASNA
jgi:hypothetical protein